MRIEQSEMMKQVERIEAEYASRKECTLSTEITQRCIAGAPQQEQSEGKQQGQAQGYGYQIGRGLSELLQRQTVDTTAPRHG